MILKSLLAFNLVSSILFQISHAEELKGTITISGAWALYPMAVKWAEEFQKIYPQVRVDISAGGAGKGMADALSGAVDIGNISRQIYPDEIKKGAWWVSVTKDAVVPTINENNPLIKELLIKGIRRQLLIDIWVTGKIRNWGEIVSLEAPHLIHLYTRSDACGAAQTWAEYLGKDQEDLLGIGVYGDPGIAEAVKRDILGIGFNNINYVYDAGTKRHVKGIKVVPIDLNGNGLVDKEENFYNSRDGILTAISNGKYPSPPARDLHFVSRGRPTKKIVIKFIRWVLTSGQKYVSESGYINLSEEEIQKGLKKIEGE